MDHSQRERLYSTESVVEEEMPEEMEDGQLTESTEQRDRSTPFHGDDSGDEQALFERPEEEEIEYGIEAPVSLAQPDSPKDGVAAQEGEGGQQKGVIKGTEDESAEKDKEGASRKSTSTTKKALSSSNKLLLKRIEELERSSADMEGKLHKERVEKNQLAMDLEMYKRKHDKIEMKQRIMDEKSAEAARSIMDGFSGSDAAKARQRFSSSLPIDKRMRIDSTHPLHPDFSCKSCTGRVVGDRFPTTGRSKEASFIPFKSMRELAACWDLMREESGLTLFNGVLGVRARAESKTVSTEGLRKAYGAGICQHQVAALAEAARSGVIIDGEEEEVSETISNLLLMGSGRSARKQLVVMASEASETGRAAGEWSRMELVKYEASFNSLAVTIKKMVDAKTLPISLFIVMSPSWSDAEFAKFKVLCSEIARKCDCSLFVSADLLSLNDVMHNELVKGALKRLTEWRMQLSRVDGRNIVILSSISGLIDALPFPAITKIIGGVRIEAVESAIDHVVHGKAVDLERFRILKESKAASQKRPRVEWGPPSKPEEKIVKLRRSGDPPHCFICKKVGHRKWQCPDRPSTSHEE